MKRLILTTLALLAIGSAFAQTKFPLFINCSEQGADVYINNKLYTKTEPNLKIQLPPAVYSIKIAKQGFVEFSANVTVKATSTGNVLSAPLQALAPVTPAPVGIGKGIIPSFLVRIACNAIGAQAFVDGAPAGAVPGDIQIKLGKHELRVSAPGYSDSVQTVDITGAIALNVTLQSQGSQLSVQSNVPGADVYINGNPAGKTPFTAQAPNGSYTLAVKAAGYADFNQNFVVSGGPVQINAILQALTQQLSIQANVNGASVLVNGNIVGNAPFAAQVPMGSYNVVVKAPGYADFTQNIVVGSGPAQVNAMLQQLSYQVAVTANVAGAAVFINGQQTGQTPYTVALVPGNYAITIKAQGYSDYQAQIAVNGPQTVSAILQPAMAQWQFRIPDALVNKDLIKDPKNPKPRNMQLYIDGVLQPEVQGQVFGAGQLPAGKHVIRFVAGGLSYEAQVDIALGKVYTFEPVLSISLK